MTNLLFNRQTFTKKRRNLSHKERDYFAKRAGLHLYRLHHRLPKGAKVALYADSFGELPTLPIVKFCQQLGYLPHLPIVKNRQLVFAPINAQQWHNQQSPLKQHRLGMAEPITNHWHKAAMMDAIICPLVAVNERGVRVGMGGGFYDRTLANYHDLKIGWCYDFQLTNTIIANAWDIAMDMVIYPNGCLIIK